MSERTRTTGPGSPALVNAIAIVNPAAGRGSALAAWSAADAVLRAEGIRIEHVLTGEPTEASSLAARAAHDGRSAVVAVGGDGTISEVVAGLLHASGGGISNVPLGIVPAGSGNDFVKALGIPAAPESAAGLLLRAKPRRIDAARVGDRFFVNGLGVGFDAGVVVEAQKIRRLRGTLLYFAALLRALKRYRPLQARVILDGSEVARRPVTLITVANGPCCGGGFYLCPDARLDDGRLDVLVADASSRRGVLDFLIRSLKSGHRGRPGIHLHQARRIEIEKGKSTPVHLDGELLPEPPETLKIEILSGHVTVLAA